MHGRRATGLHRGVLPAPPLPPQAEAEFQQPGRQRARRRHLHLPGMSPPSSVKSSIRSPPSGLRLGLRRVGSSVRASGWFLCQGLRSGPPSGRALRRALGRVLRRGLRQGLLFSAVQHPALTTLLSGRAGHAIDPAAIDPRLGLSRTLRPSLHVRDCFAII